MIRRLFLDHPAAVEETYFQHMRFAAGVGATLLMAALAAFAHALIPAACERTASRIIARLHARTHNRGQ
ncbi:MAG: DUF6356 family protein [Pseudomonadota bacterium]